MNLRRPFETSPETDPGMRSHRELMEALGNTVRRAREHNAAEAQRLLTEELIAGSTNVIDARSEFGGPNFEHRASGNNAPSAS